MGKVWLLNMSNDDLRLGIDFIFILEVGLNIPICDLVVWQDKCVIYDRWFILIGKTEEVKIWSKGNSSGGNSSDVMDSSSQFDLIGESRVWNVNLK